MKQNRYYKNLTVLQLETKITELNQAINNEYLKLGKHVPDYILSETKPVNQMIDELVHLEKLLKKRKENQS